MLANRGLNGIDGNVSTALGVAAATGAPTVALVGDLAFLHDLGALVQARRTGLSLTVVVVNNDGGGIFSFLPIARSTPHFEALFGTPHGVDLSAAAALAGARFTRAETPSALAAALEDAGVRGCTSSRRASSIAPPTSRFTMRSERPWPARSRRGGR